MVLGSKAFFWSTLACLHPIHSEGCCLKFFEMNWCSLQILNSFSPWIPKVRHWEYLVFSCIPHKGFALTLLWEFNPLKCCLSNNHIATHSLVSFLQAFWTLQSKFFLLQNSSNQHAQFPTLLHTPCTWQDAPNLNYSIYLVHVLVRWIGSNWRKYRIYDKGVRPATMCCS